MRLLCINNKPIEGARNNPEVLSKIKEGEMYEGDQRLIRGTCGWAWCIPSISTEEGYDLKRFIPCSDTPAEVIEAKETELQTA
jgi:hypothetical protein